MFNIDINYDGKNYSKEDAPIEVLEKVKASNNLIIKKLDKIYKKCDIFSRISMGASLGTFALFGIHWAMGLNSIALGVSALATAGLGVATEVMSTRTKRKIIPQKNILAYSNASIDLEIEKRAKQAVLSEASENEANI